MPAPASCPAHSLSADSSSGFESCPPPTPPDFHTTGRSPGRRELTPSALPWVEVGEWRSLPVSQGERTGRRAPQEKGPAGPGTRLLTLGPVTAAGCWETRKHSFRHRGHVSGRFRHAAAPGRPRPARPRGAWTGWAIVKVQRPPPRPWAATGPRRSAPPRASRSPHRPGARGEHVPESERTPRLGPPSRPGAQSQVGRTWPGPPSPHNQHGVRPSLHAAHIPWLNVEGKREKPRTAAATQGHLCCPEGTC